MLSEDLNLPQTIPFELYLFWRNFYNPNTMKKQNNDLFREIFQSFRHEFTV